MSSRVVSTAFWLIALLPVAAGTVAMDYFALSAAGLQTQSASWPSVQGTITQSEVETVRSNKSTTYRPKLVYTYSVDGQHYEGSKYRYSSWSAGDPERVEALLTRYSMGASIPVYYRHAQPLSHPLK